MPVVLHGWLQGLSILFGCRESVDAGFIFEVQVSVQFLYELVGIGRDVFELCVILWCVVEAFCQ